MKQMAAGDMLIDQDGTYSGMIGGDAIIQQGRNVRLTGMVAGDVIVRAGARVSIEGMVGGKVVNHGGEITGDGTAR